VEKFEQDFASFCGTKCCIGVNSGTDALRFALIAAGINKGDIVCRPNAFIATTEAVSQAGADRSSSILMNEPITWTRRSFVSS
jgi:dTDP-4-amino-4,6-dideoxygalactose transaminase